MEKRRSMLAVRWWPLLLPVALFVLALQPGGTLAARSAGMFPDFIATPGVSARGVAVDKIGNVFVSVSQGTHILLWQYTPDGVGPSVLADMGVGTIGGLMVTAEGDLYVAMAYSGAGSATGVWRVDRRGRIDRLPGTENIFFANGLAFDEVGTLYVTESVTPTQIVGGKPAGPGSIWRIPRGGQAELWWRDVLLQGNGQLGQPVWIGANGIAYHQDNLYVTNTEQGTVLRIPVLADGSPGEPYVWSLQPVTESPLPLPPMGDGIVLDVHGNLYVAVLSQSAVVRIDARDVWSQETVAAFQVVAHDGVPNAQLDFPASLFFGTGKGERQNLFVTNLGMGKLVAPPLPWAGSGLVKIDAGVPGEPLR
jgi:sugar lactone lactonase YvrE